MSDVLPRISVDFNTMMADPKDRVAIPTHVHPELFDILQPELRIIIFEERDMKVEAVVELDEEFQHLLPHSWFAIPDWTTLKDYDEATGQYLPSDRLSNR
jgi:hypothetical protein